MFVDAVCPAKLTRLTVSLAQAIAAVEVVFASSLIAWNLLIALYSLLMLKQVKKRKVCTRLTSASPSSCCPAISDSVELDRLFYACYQVLDNTYGVAVAAGVVMVLSLVQSLSLYTRGMLGRAVRISLAQSLTQSSYSHTLFRARPSASWRSCVSSCTPVYGCRCVQVTNCWITPPREQMYHFYVPLGLVWLAVTAISIRLLCFLARIPNPSQNTTAAIVSPMQVRPSISCVHPIYRNATVALLHTLPVPPPAAVLSPRRSFHQSAAPSRGLLPLLPGGIRGTGHRPRLHPNGTQTPGAAARAPYLLHLSARVLRRLHLQVNIIYIHTHIYII